MIIIAKIVGSSQVWLNISSTNAIKVLDANPNRAGLFIQNFAGTGDIAIGFDDPRVQVGTGAKRGIVVAQAGQYTESPPNVNTAAIWIISTNADEDVIVREDTFVE